MSSAVSFCLLTLILTLSVAKNTTHARYKIAVKSYASTPVKSENLEIILDYLRKEQELYPSIVSLVSSEIQSNFVDLVSKYVANELIVSYKTTTNNLSRRYVWQNRIDLTWILIIDNIGILNSFIYEQSHIWKATNQYLIIITARSIAMSPREIFQSVWENHGVYRIVAISVQEDFRCLNSYLPFKKDKRNEYGVVRKTCLVDWKNNTELYDNFEKLNGYPIRVVVFPSVMMNIKFDEDTNEPKYERLDADAMLLLQEAMGAKFHVEIISNFESNEDPFHRTLEYIENGKSEMIFTSFFTHEYKEYRKYEFTASIYDDNLCLIAPTAGFVPKSYMPILPFASNLWAALAIYNILVSVLWFLVKYYSESFRRGKAILLPLMKNTGFIPSRQSDSSPRIHPYVSSCFDLVETWCYPLKEDGGKSGSTAAQRAFLFGTLFFGLIVTGLYQSYLVSSLSDPFHYPELNTLEEVADSNLTIITKYDNLKQNTFTDNTSLANRLKSKTIVSVSNRSTNYMVAFDRNIIALSRCATLKLDNLSNYYDKNGNDLLHIVEERPVTYLLSYVVRLYSPYRERINSLLLRMQEAGLVELWYKNMIYPMYADEQRRKLAKSDRRIRLTMEHYSLTFLGLLFGLLSCAVVFFTELYIAKRCNYYGKKRRILLKNEKAVLTLITR